MWMVQALLWMRNSPERWKKQLCKKSFGWKGSKYEQWGVFLLCRIFIEGMGNVTVWDILLAQMKQLGPHQRAECAILLPTCFRYLAGSHCPGRIRRTNMSTSPYGRRILSLLLFLNLEGSSLQTRYPPNPPQHRGRSFDQIVRDLSLFSSQPPRQRNEVKYACLVWFSVGYQRTDEVILRPFPVWKLWWIVIWKLGSCEQPGAIASLWHSFYYITKFCSDSPLLFSEGVSTDNGFVS